MSLYKWLFLDVEADFVADLAFHLQQTILNVFEFGCYLNFVRDSSDISALLLPYNKQSK